MKKILLMGLVLFMANKSVLGQCQDGIALKKDNRDWVKTYNNLVIKYKAKTEKVSSLKSFFYTGDKPKDCISLKDLQSLNSKVQEVFKQAKSDKTVTDFIGAISFIAKTNPPIAKSDAPKIEAQKAVTSPIIQPKNVANENLDKHKDAKISNLNSELEKLEDEKITLTDDRNFYKKSCLFLLGLLIGLIIIWILMIRNLKKESKKEIEALKTTFENQKEHYTKTIKELEAKNRENKNTFREAVPPVETKSEVKESVKEEPKKAVVPEPPKTPEIPKQFYLSTPAVSSDGKGIFDGSEVYNATSLSSLYHFTLINDKKAEFKFLNTPNTVKDALTLPDRYLQPACEYTGLNSKATKIITTKLGQAVKDGNNWKVTQKAEIRFE